MTIVIEQVAILMAFAVVGFVLQRTGIVEAAHTKLLSTLCVYVFLPCQVFRTFANNFTPEYLSEKYVLVLTGGVVLLILAVVGYFLSKVLTKDAFQQSIVKYSMITPNYGYIGYAMAEGVFGTQMLLNFMMASFPIALYTYTIGFCMLTKQKLSAKRLLNPVTMAMALGAVVGLLGIPLPDVVNTALSKGAACVSPLGMILTGTVIARFAFKVMLGNKLVYFLGTVRLLVLPLAVGACLRLVGLEQCLIPLVLLMCMPCGVNTVVFPKLIGEDCETGAALAFVTSILCCVTIPLVLHIFGI